MAYSGCGASRWVVPRHSARDRPDIAEEPVLKNGFVFWVDLKSAGIEAMQNVIIVLGQFDVVGEAVCDRAPYAVLRDAIDFRPRLIGRLQA